MQVGWHWEGKAVSAGSSAQEERAEDGNSPSRDLQGRGFLAEGVLLGWEEENNSRGEALSQRQIWGQLISSTSCSDKRSMERKACRWSIMFCLQLLHEFYSAQRVPGLRKPPVTLTICAYACPELLRSVQKAGIWQKEAVSSGGWAGFHCPEWSVIPFLTNALKSLCLRDQRIHSFAIEVLRGHSPTVVWSKLEASQLTRLLSWPWKQCGLAVFILIYLCKFGSDLGAMIRQTSCRNKSSGLKIRQGRLWWKELTRSSMHLEAWKLGHFWQKIVFLSMAL